MLIEHLEPKLFYSAIIVPFVPVYFLLLFLSARTRHEQIKMSIVFAFVGALVDSFIYFLDYWHPMSVFTIQLGSITLFPESFIYGGMFGGIAAVAYQIASRKTPAKQGVPGKWTRAITCASLFLAVSLSLWHIGLNSIFATALGALSLSIFITRERPDLIGPSLWSGLIMSGMMFAFYVLVFTLIGNGHEIFEGPTWLLHKTTFDIRIAHVPLTELFWGFCAGSSLSVFYSYLRTGRFA